MPRYDDYRDHRDRDRDRYGNTRLYVGRLSSRTRSRDLHDLFSRYGRVRDVDMKHDFAFVEFSDTRDADDARYSLNGRDFDGSRIIVEFAKGGPRGSGGGGGGGGGSREYLGRGPPPGSGRCFNCGIDGHWARDCKAGDWKNKCYRCGERGHIERNCQNSPKSLKRGRSYSRSLSRSPPRRGRSRSFSRSRSRSYSRSRSPAPKRERSVERSRSPAYSRSPEGKNSPPPRGGKSSQSPAGSISPREKDDRSPPRERNGSDYSQSPRERAGSPPRERNGSDYSQSPRRGDNNSRSPMSQEGGSPAGNNGHQSPEMNGQNGHSPVMRNREHDEGATPKGSESPRD